MFKINWNNGGAMMIEMDESEARLLSDFCFESLANCELISSAILDVVTGPFLPAAGERNFYGKLHAVAYDYLSDNDIGMPIAEAARISGLHETCIRRHIAIGNLPVVVRPNTIRLVTRRSLSRFMDEVKPTMRKMPKMPRS